MRDWDAARVAAAGGREPARGAAGAAARAGPPAREHRLARAAARASCSSGCAASASTAAATPREALEAGAWGVLVAREHAATRSRRGGRPRRRGARARGPARGAAGARARVARASCARGGAKVVAITGSTGKTSTKDILAALLATRLRTVASPENLNTEIGLPLALLAAPADTRGARARAGDARAPARSPS